MQDKSEEQSEQKSRSQRKREAEALQELGERLVALGDDQLARMPLEERLREAILQAGRITARGGRRRQLQLIGKLMRAADGPAIARALAELEGPQRRDARRLHALEAWRARLLEGGPEAVEELVCQYPAVDRSELSELVRRVRQGAVGKRVLFRFLSGTLPEHLEPGQT